MASLQLNKLLSHVAGSVEESQWDLLLLLHKTGDELGTPGKA